MNSRRKSVIVSIICLSLLLAGRFTISHAGEPQEKVRQTINDVMAILRDESLKVPERTEERRAKIRQVVTERFGFEEMAKRAMGRHWRTLTAEQRQEFLPLFSGERAPMPPHGAFRHFLEAKPFGYHLADLSPTFLRALRDFERFIAQDRHHVVNRLANFFLRFPGVTDGESAG